jgi:hypothetical protein
MLYGLCCQHSAVTSRNNKQNYVEATVITVLNTFPFKHFHILKRLSSEAITVITEAISTSETSVNFYQTTRRNATEDISSYSPPWEPEISQFHIFINKLIGLFLTFSSLMSCFSDLRNDPGQQNIVTETLFPETRAEYGFVFSVQRASRWRQKDREIRN